MPVYSKERMREYMREYRTKFPEKHHKHQRRLVLKRAVQHANLPSREIIEKHNVGPDELRHIFETIYLPQARGIS